RSASVKGEFGSLASLLQSARLSASVGRANGDRGLAGSETNLPLAASRRRVPDPGRLMAAVTDAGPPVRRVITSGALSTTSSDPPKRRAIIGIAATGPKNHMPIVLPATRFACSFA